MTSAAQPGHEVDVLSGCQRPESPDRVVDVRADTEVRAVYVAVDRSAAAAIAVVVPAPGLAVVCGPVDAHGPGHRVVVGQ